MNPNEPASLDGRYFGPLPIAAIAGLAEPLWTCAPVRSCGLSGPLRYRNHPRFNERLPPGCLPCPPLPEVNTMDLTTLIAAFAADGRPEDHARTDLAPVAQRTRFRDAGRYGNRRRRSQLVTASHVRDTAPATTAPSATPDDDERAARALSFWSWRSPPTVRRASVPQAT
jgi:hypothetical protein